MTDASGAVVWDAAITPFGMEHSIAGGETNNNRFPGQYFDAETGLHYNHWRDYDPTTGRYIQSDPIGLAGGLNTYAYVGGNPVNLVDPDGLQRPPRGGRPGPWINNLGPRGAGGGRGAGGPNVPEGEFLFPKPTYKPNPAHARMPSGRARNPRKTPEPEDAEELYQQCIPDYFNMDASGKPKTWWVQNSNGDYYRYSDSNDGTAHYSGTFPPKSPLVPNHVKQRYSGVGGGEAGVPPLE